MSASCNPTQKISIVADSLEIARDQAVLTIVANVVPLSFVVGERTSRFMDLFIKLRRVGQWKSTMRIIVQFSSTDFQYTSASKMSIVCRVLR